MMVLMFVFLELLTHGCLPVTESLKMAAGGGGWLWLVGGNRVITLVRFPLAVRRMIRRGIEDEVARDCGVEDLGQWADPLTCHNTMRC